jgi:integrase/recombinase XerD
MPAPCACRELLACGFSSCALGHRFRTRSVRANALDAGADIAKVQEWLGHANVRTTRVYDHRKTRTEDSPTFKVKY